LDWPNLKVKVESNELRTAQECMRFFCKLLVRIIQDFLPFPKTPSPTTHRPKVLEYIRSTSEIIVLCYNSKCLCRFTDHDPHQPYEGINFALNNCKKDKWYRKVV